ncbi:AraC family transcriptional regulator [soil metagenome]
MRHGAIHFGTMSLVLALGCVQGIVVLILLLRARRNQEANRFLAALLLVSVLRILPYIAGYAGFYDAYPWLSFAPYNLSLALGPLVLLHVARLTSGGLPRRWLLWLVPGGVQFIYYSVLFLQPLTFKNWWDDAVQRPFVSPAQVFLTLGLAGWCLVAAHQRYRQYQAWLSDNVSFRDELRMDWIRNFLTAFGVVIVVWAGFAIADWMHPLNYFAEFPLYVVFTAFVYYLGLEGWRHADRLYPVPEEEWIGEEQGSAPSVVEVGSDTTPAKTAFDPWPAQGEAWLREIEQRELWRNPDLSATSLARTLGTNTTYLSKALNEGLGQSFNECINRLRVEAVQRAMQAPEVQEDLLTMALDAGFRSKASFNRAFKTYAGKTPSEFRQEHAAQTSQNIKT